MLHCPDLSPLSMAKKCQAFSFQLRCSLGWSLPSSPPPLATAFSVSDYLQPLYLRESWHRPALVPFQFLVMCLLYNKPSLEQLPCAGSLYFTDYCSISLTSLVFRNVSSRHCTYHEIIKYFLPLLLLHLLYMVKYIYQQFNLKQKALILGPEWPCL